MQKPVRKAQVQHWEDARLLEGLQFRKRWFWGYKNWWSASVWWFVLFSSFSWALLPFLGSWSFPCRNFVSFSFCEVRNLRVQPHLWWARARLYVDTLLATCPASRSTYPTLRSTYPTLRTKSARHLAQPVRHLAQNLSGTLLKTCPAPRSKPIRHLTQPIRNLAQNLSCISLKISPTPLSKYLQHWWPY